MNGDSSGVQSPLLRADGKDMLYHYCPCEAFRSIVKTGRLWLTDMFSTNDREEHRWLRRIAAEVIAEAVKESTDDAGGEEDPTLTLLRQIPLDSDETGDIYLACFSPEDSLGQWRAYADDGRGFAIGFSRVYIEATQKRLDIDLELLDVEYDRTAQRQVVRDAIEAARRQWRDAYRILGQTEIQACNRGSRNTFNAKIWQYAPKCKHHAFRDEREVRLVYYPNGLPVYEGHILESGYRVGRGGIARYYELPIGTTNEGPIRQPIKRIMLGPKNTSSLRHVRSVLRDCGFDIPEEGFSRSDIPYQ